jgi:hypothetical protein
MALTMVRKSRLQVVTKKLTLSLTLGRNDLGGRTKRSISRLMHGGQPGQVSLRRGSLGELWCISKASRSHALPAGILKPSVD